MINAASIKPLDEELLARSAGKTGHVVTVEDHSIEGGLGESGDARGLYAKHGLDAAGIASSVRKFLGR